MSERAATVVARRVAVVTGGARGIGLAVGRALLQQGERVALFDRDAAALGQALGELEREGFAPRIDVVDVSDAAAVEHAVSEVERELGAIGLAVNVAGVLRTGRLVELSDADWQATFETNVNGAFYLFRSIGRRMQLRRAGNLVAVGSNAGAVPRSEMGAYAASKAALLALVRCLGLELAEAGIRCNLVSPGSTTTDMQRALWKDEQSEQRVIAGDLASYRIGIPLGRLASPEDIANAVLFLASERARHITLHDLRVDGGATLDA
jgi:2,3-dihydro-2,3-dihydroxybenzoate dehydrogenase